MNQIGLGNLTWATSDRNGCSDFTVDHLFDPVDRSDQKTSKLKKRLDKFLSKKMEQVLKRISPVCMKTINS